MLSKQKLFPVYCSICGAIAGTFDDNLPDGLPKSYCYKCTCTMTELMQSINKNALSYENKHITNSKFKLKSFDGDGKLNAEGVYIYIRDPDRFIIKRSNDVTDLSDLNVKIT